MSNQRFAGKTAIVTGAASGIGLATADRLRAEGANLVLVDRDADKLRQTAAQLPGATDHIRLLPGDVREANLPRKATSVAKQAFASLDVLINNAAVLRLVPALEVTDEAWEEVIAINLTSVFRWSREIGRALVEQGRGGRIVNVTSIHAVTSEPNAIAYTASKAGVEGMTRTLASELAPFNITVNCVRPGATWTGMAEGIFDAAVVEALETRIPLGRIAQPSSIAAAIAFLASEDAEYMTGTCIAVDGGFTMNGSLPNLVYGDRP